MIKVNLNNLEFRAFHGIHSEEKILGNQYVVNVAVEIHEEKKVIHSIMDTVNYEGLYNIIRERMNVPTPLLETIAMEIGNEIYREFPIVQSVEIEIIKKHPPVEGMVGEVGITWYKKF
jgi:7,8-dihydroneopterin aldolase/epimerase/oxygenase